ncbi:MAG: hypothetical protein Q8865_08145 [Bacillota bacterium]|nr:hypothetical protein [Bacillota bacterium]
MSNVFELRNKDTGISFKQKLFGGYDKNAVKDYIDQLELSLKEAQENYSAKTEELKARIDSLVAERNRIAAKEKESSENAENLSADYSKLNAEKIRLEQSNIEMQQKLSLLPEGEDFSIEKYAVTCSKLSEAEDKICMFAAKVKGLTSALNAKNAENDTLSSAFQKALDEKEIMRKKLEMLMSAAREDRDFVCNRFIEAAANQQAAAEALRKSLDEAMSLLDGLSVDAFSLVSSLPSRIK